MANGLLLQTQAGVPDGGDDDDIGGIESVRSRGSSGSTWAARESRPSPWRTKSVGSGLGEILYGPSPAQLVQPEPEPEPKPESESDTESESESEPEEAATPSETPALLRRSTSASLQAVRGGVWAVCWAAKVLARSRSRSSAPRRSGRGLRQVGAVVPRTWVQEADVRAGEASEADERSAYQEYLKTQLSDPKLSKAERLLLHVPLWVAPPLCFFVWVFLWALSRGDTAEL